MSSLELPQIGVISVIKRGEVTIPTVDNIESRMNDFLEKRGTRVFSSSGYELIALEATAPHHPDGSMVYWINRKNDEKNITPWGEHGWEDVLLDTQFINQLELSIHEDQIQNPEYRWVMHYGFCVSQSKIPGEKIIKRGLQSHARMHLHRVKNISEGFEANRVLCVESSKSDAMVYALVLNEAGERAVNHYKSYLTMYGQRMKFTQPLGNKSVYEHQRTVFGFDSLYDALTNSYDVRTLMEPTWQKVIETIVQDSYEFYGFRLDLIQSTIPNFSLFFPSRTDRTIFEIDPDARVCVFPFAICNSQSYLTPGGVFLDHVK